MNADQRDMPTRRRLMLQAGAAAGLLLPRGAAALGARRPAGTIEFNSPYNFVHIEKQGSIVTFWYAFKGARMSSVDLANPPYQMVPYTGYYYAAQLVRPRPARVLMAGLGAGGFNRLFNLVHSDARLVTVEIDPMILRLAQDHAGFQTGPGNEVALEDARVFLRNAQETYDWILLDAFDRDAQIPIHLTTTEFFRILRDRLAENGVMLTNLHQGTRFFASHVLTIRAVFPEVVLIPVKGGNNVVVMAATRAAPTLAQRVAIPEGGAEEHYRRHGVDLAEIAGRMMSAGDYLAEIKDRGMVLTDDFAPVESLDRGTMPIIRPRAAEPR